MEHPPTSSAIADRDATIAGLRKELSTLRSHLRHRLYAVNDGFIIPCLLDMSAAWERMAEALHVAPVDSEKMAARCEELASIISTIASRGNLADCATDPACKDRASIVAFLAAVAILATRDRLISQAGLLRTLAAQIERGDDRQGGE